MFAGIGSIWLHCSLFINMSLFTGTASHIFDDESCFFLGKATQIHYTNITRFQWIQSSLHDSKLLLRDRADRRDKARENFPEIQETNCKRHGFRRKWEIYIFCGLSSYFGRVRILLWVCLWSLQIILMYTCMLKIISPPFYCAVTLMDSCVTFYFHYNFCQEHEKPKCLSNL